MHDAGGGVVDPMDPMDDMDDMDDPVFDAIEGVEFAVGEARGSVAPSDTNPQIGVG